MTALRAWAVMANEKGGLHLDNLRPNQRAAQEHRAWLEKSNPHGGKRRVVQVQITPLSKPDGEME